jgi:hypothetical protein
MIDKAQLDRVRMANKTPLNLAAARFLEDKTAWDGEMTAISLMRWGMESGINPVPTGPGQPYPEQMESPLNAMTRWPPVEATGFLANPESEPDEAELVQELADEVDAAATPEDAAVADNLMPDARSPQRPTGRCRWLRPSR